MLIVHNEALLDQIKAHYQPHDLQALLQFLKGQGTFDFPSLENGLFPAAVVLDDTRYTGYSSIWVRDNVYIAYAHWVTGDRAIATKTLNTLMTYFHQHRHRFEAIITGQADPQNRMNRPHIRFNGDTLAEIDETWSHAQNDALGYFLWFYCELAQQGAVRPQADAWQVLALFPLYLEVIAYWQDEDNGHWEEVRKIEASSIGAVVAGLRSLRELWKSANESRAAAGKTVDLQRIDALIHSGQAALDEILPAESIQPDPQFRLYDAALLFLIYPLRVVEGAIADSILHNVITHLQGNYGIKRYIGDSFWAPNYKEKLSPETRTIDFSDNMAMRDALLPEGGEAQWCLFDSIVSAIWGHRFQQTGQPELLQSQIHYFNRALGQLTPADSPFGGYKCPELYYQEQGRYVPNDSTPLLWTQANLLLAFWQLEQSLSKLG